MRRLQSKAAGLVQRKRSIFVVGSYAVQIFFLTLAATGILLSDLGLQDLYIWLFFSVVIIILGAERYLSLSRHIGISIFLASVLSVGIYGLYIWLKDCPTDTSSLNNSAWYCWVAPFDLVIILWYTTIFGILMAVLSKAFFLGEKYIVAGYRSIRSLQFFRSILFIAVISMTSSAIIIQVYTSVFSPAPYMLYSSVWLLSGIYMLLPFFLALSLKKLKVAGMFVVIGTITTSLILWVATRFYSTIDTVGCPSSEWQWFCRNDVYDTKYVVSYSLVGIALGILLECILRYYFYKKSPKQVVE